jgi:muramoyltetrapeptide carboxypeptidase
MNDFKSDRSEFDFHPVPALRRGDTVGVAAPASPVPRTEFHAALGTLRRLGLHPIYRPDICDRHLYVSRPDAARADELTDLFLNPAVKAIFCACPGYGSLRLLPLLPWEQLRNHPKIIMGYSDLTALLLAIHGRCAFPTFHGPTLVRGFLPEELSSESVTALRRTLFRNVAPYRFRLSGAPAFGDGSVTAPLIGGNLEMLSSLVGTPWQPVTAGKILFLEDVDEGEESLDQLLTHLRLGGLFAGVRAVLFGDMSGNPLTPPYRLEDVVRHALGDLGLPILTGFPAGHGRRNLPLVLGARYTISIRARTVVQVDSGVAHA